MTSHSFASKSVALLLYAAYAMLPIGLALLAAGLLNAQTHPTSTPDIADHPTQLPVPVSAVSPGKNLASTPLAHADRVSTSSANHARREADRTVHEPPGIR